MDDGDGRTMVRMHVMPLNSLKNDWDGEFDVMCILPQLKIMTKRNV